MSLSASHRVRLLTYALLTTLPLWHAWIIILVNLIDNVARKLN